MLHPDAELHQPPETPDPASSYGRDDWERGLAIWLTEWQQPRFEPLEVDHAGAGVIMRRPFGGYGEGEWRTGG
ncbi:MAG TPA: hypothetical protein VLZ06_02890 [Solirubrobacteraceae bacterium]|nr:hypothetical protein [Solirubrobacteraceae bacterium]